VRALFAQTSSPEQQNAFIPTLGTAGRGGGERGIAVTPLDRVSTLSAMLSASHSSFRSPGVTVTHRKWRPAVPRHSHRGHSAYLFLSFPPSPPSLFSAVWCISRNPSDVRVGSGFVFFVPRLPFSKRALKEKQTSDGKRKQERERERDPYFVRYTVTIDQRDRTTAPSRTAARVLGIDAGAVEEQGGAVEMGIGGGRSCLRLPESSLFRVRQNFRNISARTRSPLGRHRWKISITISVNERSTYPTRRPRFV